MAVRGRGTSEHVDGVARPTFDAERFDADLGAYLLELDMPENLDAALRYALLGPGKRIRPRLTHAACVAVGGHPSRALAAAMAVEMVHAFSLVHDDLPALDDDATRRGRPATHVAFGEALGLLAGDGLLALAFQVIAERAPEPAIAAAQIAELARGTTAMVAGQVLDTVGGGDGWPALDPAERLRRIHLGKTAALIRAACRMGGLAGGASAAELSALTSYGEALGLLFQVTDDLLDVEQASEHVGKRTSKDAEAGKLTSPGLLGVGAARASVERLREAAAAAVRGLPDPGELAEISMAVARRTR